MSRAIVTYATGSHEQLLSIALPRFKEFAERHKYDLIIGKKKCDRPPAWDKIPLLIDALTKYEEVLWLDCDLVIIDTSEDIPMPQGDAVHAMVRHFSAMSEVPNTGVWYLRRSALPLLEKAWELEVFWNHGWWEQAAILTAMGYSVPPQGTDFDWTKCRCVYATEWMKKCYFLKTEFNSHPNYRAAKPRIVHCSYRNVNVRAETMRRLVENPSYDYPAWKSS